MSHLLDYWGMIQSREVIVGYWIRQAIQNLVNDLEDDDKIVYFLHHSELDSDGKEKVKTIGKMLDEKLTVEGCFDIVLFCQDHKFFTQSNGMSTAKSPEGMFDLEIPNDLKAVDTAIRDYYGMKKREG